jgi:hypothetical protein
MEAMTAERFAEIRQMLKIYESLEERHQKCVEIGKASANDTTSREIERLVTDIPENELREYRDLKERNEKIRKKLEEIRAVGKTIALSHNRAKSPCRRGPHRPRAGRFRNEVMFRIFADQTGFSIPELMFFQKTLSETEEKEIFGEDGYWPSMVE